MIRVEDGVEVARDPEAAFAFLSAVERYPEWLPGVVAAEQTSPGPVGPGTTFRLRLASPAGPIEAAGQVTAVDPGRAMAISGTAPQGRVAGHLSLDPTAAGTSVTVAMEIELSGMYRFAEGMVAAELRRGLPGVLADLKTRLEADPA